MQRQRGRSRIGWGVLLAGICCCVIAADSLQAAGQLSVSTAKGLTLAVDPQWFDSGGYRPVKVTIAAATPSPGDRSFHLEYRARTHYNSRSVTVGQDLDLPGGSTSATVTLHVPQHYTWTNFELDVWEDGRYLKLLSQAAGFGGGQDWAEGLPNMLFVADKPAVAPTLPVVPAGVPMMAGIITVMPEVRSTSLASLFPPVDSRNGVRVVAAQQGATPHLDTSISLPLDQLPETWIDYSGVDIVCLSLDQAKLIAAQEAARWNALRTWVSAGGNLLVSGVASDSPQLAELERLLGKPRSDVDDRPAAARGWATPAPENFKKQLPSPFAANGWAGVQAAPGMAAGLPGMPGDAPVPQTAPPTPPRTPAPLHDPPFVSRRHGLGLVAAVAADDLCAQEAEQWQGLLNTIGLDRWVWFRRHGLSPQRENRDFWNWPIPGVGLAPVTAFQVLITAFVVAIGPLNYWWLRRRGKLHLLVMVVPLSAALVTLALFGYALAVDGLGVRVRCRSYTLLDQRTGEASCWARTSYYAGLAPSGGLKFSDDVAAIALLPQTPDERHGELRSRTLSWLPGEQKLVSGWIASRAPTQLLTVRSRRSAAGLQVKLAAGGAPAQVENRLGVRVERLLLADAAGNHYRAESIAPDGTATLEAADLGVEGAWLGALYEQRRPADPSAFDRRNSGFVSGVRFRWVSPWNNALPPATLQTSLLERELDWAFRLVAPGAGSKPPGLSPRSYLAIVERSPEVEYGVDSYEEEESLHLVVGRW